MVSAGADKLLKVWDVASALALAASPTAGSDASVPKLRATAATAAHDKDINAIAVAPNDSLICTASQDRTAKVNLTVADTWWGLTHHSMIVGVRRVNKYQQCMLSIANLEAEVVRVSVTVLSTRSTAMKSSS